MHTFSAAFLSKIIEIMFMHVKLIYATSTAYLLLATSSGVDADRRVSALQDGQWYV